MRINNSNLARFLSVDPIASEYPWYSPYQFAGNTPIQASDIDGLEPKSEILQKGSTLPLLKLMPSSTLQYTIPENAIVHKVPEVLIDKSVTRQYAAEITKFHDKKDLAIKNYINKYGEFPLNLPKPKASGALTTVYPEMLLIGGPAIKTGSKVLDVVYEVAIGTMGKEVTAGKLLATDAKTAVRQGLDGGYFDFDKVRVMIPEGTPNTFEGGATIGNGEKYLFDFNGSSVELKWHTPDANAAIKFPGSNSGKTNTAQIKVDKELLNTNGTFTPVKKADNSTHIPLSKPK
jgi:hypothetical protein